MKFAQKKRSKLERAKIPYRDSKKNTRWQNIFFFPVFLFFLGACSGSNPTPPVHILSADKMVEILIDLHVYQAELGITTIPPDTAKLFFELKESKLLKKEHATEKQFEQSYQYYMEDVYKMNQIYSRVVDSLGLYEAEAQAKEENEKKKRQKP